MIPYKSLHLNFFKNGEITDFIFARWLKDLLDTHTYKTLEPCWWWLLTRLQCLRLCFPMSRVLEAQGSYLRRPYYMLNGWIIRIQPSDALFNKKLNIFWISSLEKGNRFLLFFSRFSMCFALKHMHSLIFFHPLCIHLTMSMQVIKF